MKPLIIKTLLFIISLCYSVWLYAQNRNFENLSFKLQKTKTGHYTFPLQLNECVEANALIESGVHAMLIDSAFAFNHLNKLNIELTPCQKEQINLGGKKYRISHRAKIQMKLNKETYYKGEVFLLARFKHEYEVALPIQNLYHTNGKRCILLNLSQSKLQVLDSCRASKTDWDILAMNTNTYLNMPAIRTEIRVKGEKYEASLKGNFNLDLGNAAFLFLFEQSKAVQAFFSENTSIELQKGYDKQGNVIAMAFVPQVLSIDSATYNHPTIAITKFLPKFTTEGTLGLKFFNQNEVIFDFDNNLFGIKKKVR